MKRDDFLLFSHCHWCCRSDETITQTLIHFKSKCSFVFPQFESGIWFEIKKKTDVTVIGKKEKEEKKPLRSHRECERNI